MAYGGEWHHQVDELNTGSLFAQRARLAYPQSRIRNSELNSVGGGWRRAFVGAMQPVVQLQGVYGAEANTSNPRQDDLSRRLYTGRVGVSVTPAPRWGASIGANYTRSNYKAADPLFLTPRKDNYYGFEAGASYRFTKQISVRGDYLHSAKIGRASCRERV